MGKGMLPIFVTILRLNREILSIFDTGTVLSRRS
jgi:hypothetical protein